MGNQRHSPLGRQRGGRVAKADSGKKWGARSGNADAGPGANVSRRAMRSCVAGRVRKQEGSGLPHPGHSQAPGAADPLDFRQRGRQPLRVASQFRRKAVSVELTHARQAELCEQGQLGRCGQ
jgi:hypothetical protein